MVTWTKPDLVIIGNQRKFVEIFELTVPGETRISTAHNIKFEKYQYINTDINTYKVSVTPFEIGSNTGYITRENKEGLKMFHKCKGSHTKKPLRNSMNFSITYQPTTDISKPGTHLVTISMYLWLIREHFLHYVFIFIQKRNQDIPAGGSVNYHFTLPLRFTSFFVVWHFANQ